MNASTLMHIFNLYSAVPPADLDTFDLMAINGLNADLPRFKDHDSIIALCRQFAPVHRKRSSDRSVEIVTDENGEEVWIVGKDEMPRSAMLRLAAQFTDKPSRFRK